MTIIELGITIISQPTAPSGRNRIARVSIRPGALQIGYASLDFSIVTIGLSIVLVTSC